MRSGGIWCSWRLCQMLLLAFSLYCLTTLASSATTSAAPKANSLARHHAVVTNGRTIGSAVALDEGLFLTAAHVLENRQPGDNVHLVMPGRTPAAAPATILQISRNMDVALLRSDRSSAPPARLGATGPGRNQQILAIGVDASRGPYARRLAKGHVQLRGVHQHPFGTGLIADMPGARAGFSGGPVFDRSGNLVGILCAIGHSDRSGQSVFVLPIDIVLTNLGLQLTH